MAGNQDVSKGHGGARPNAGRRSLESKVLRDTKWLKARGMSPLQAHEILSHVIDESEMWRKIFKSEDDRVLLQALMFLTSMRDGKPTQQINVNSQSITLHARDIESARAIIREIRGDASPLQVDNPSLGLLEDNLGTSTMAHGNDNSELSCPELSSLEENSPEQRRTEGETMLFEDEGGK